ncbi:hypothetical protein [Haladaptatus salinisoli]|uniref:hypothetical protein n=1 Tax=Haladaptatus salinisoli TaxID=2884876 RepID=UPI001D0AC167|nr:hypothetical protein [Haladaptatus salinisoli]
MSKLSQDDLILGVQSELVTFLQAGTINERSIARALDFTALDIADFDRLKRIHFCLSEQAVEFVRKLPERLRRIKTVTQREAQTSRNEVRGAINWNQTMKLRSTTSYGDRSVFACETPGVAYDIPENRVLKKLLSVIEQTLSRDLTQTDHEWRIQRWDESLIDEFQRLFAQNVHLNRIPDANEIQLTQRDLNAARTSRQELYAEAYELYTLYEQLLANEFTDEAVQELLRSTLVVPDRLPRLFELFCVFRLIRGLAKDYPGVELQVIEPGADEIAVLESEDLRVDVYHDKSGPLRFYEPLDEEPIEHPFFERYREVLETHSEMIESFFNRSADSRLYQGRPDIVITIHQTVGGSQTLQEVTLGEIKYSDNDRTFGRGLKELLEYMKYAKVGKSYLDETDVVLKGVLITDGVDAASNVGRISHQTATELGSDTMIGRIDN